MTITELNTDPAQVKGDASRTPSTGSGEIDYRDTNVAFYVAEAAGKDVLDLGCIGHGPDHQLGKYWIHGAFRARAKSVLGVDHDVDKVNALRARGYTIIVGDAQDLQLGQQFDVVAAGGLMTHLQDLRGFLASCKAHMEPQGRLLITVPNPWYWRTVLRAGVLAEACADREQLNWICPRSMRQALERHDLKILKITYGSRYLRDRIMPLPRGWKHTSLQFVIAQA